MTLSAPLRVTYDCVGGKKVGKTYENQAKIAGWIHFLVPDA